VAPHRQISRRTAVSAMGLLGFAGAAGGCDSSGNARPAPASGTASSVTPAADVDGPLRQRAIVDERRLLAACAAPAGQEPFATLRRTHLDHLRALTGHPVAAPAAARRAPARQALATAERAGAAARRADCVRASPALAPLLASIAASGEVASAVLLAP
jgi:hypothetical protein